MIQSSYSLNTYILISTGISGEPSAIKKCLVSISEAVSKDTKRTFKRNQSFTCYWIDGPFKQNKSNVQ